MESLTGKDAHTALVEHKIIRREGQGRRAKLFLGDTDIRVGNWTVDHWVKRSIVKYDDGCNVYRLA